MQSQTGRRGAWKTPRSQALVAAAALFAAVPALPCSWVSSGHGAFSMQDGTVHWMGTGPDPDVLGGEDAAYWMTRTSLDGDPEARLVAPPRLPEGEPYLVAVLRDGSSWWRISCSGYDAPTSTGCDSLLLVDKAGEPVGWISELSTSHYEFEDDGSVYSLVHSDARFDPTEARMGSQMLRLWKGRPQPLPGFDSPSRGSSEDDEEAVRRDDPSRDWELLWEAAAPRVPGRPWGQIASSLDRSRERIALVLPRRTSVTAGVYSVVMSGSKARLDPLWEAEFPRAAHGLPTDSDGHFALTVPWAMALSSRGELAMANWEIGSDCSRERPRGFVVFDETGRLIADIRREAGESHVEDLLFDSQDRLLVGGWQTLRTYTAEGDLLGVAPRSPSAWESRREALKARIEALTEASPLEEWLALYLLLESDGDPLSQAREQLAERLLVEGWPQIDRLVPESVWLSLGRRFCQAHPDAAASAIDRFEAARDHMKPRWLELVSHCVDRPTPHLARLVESWLELEHREKRAAAERAALRWSPRERGVALWQQAEALDPSPLAPDSYHHGREIYGRLLGTLPAGRYELETRLLSSGRTAGVAEIVLLSSFDHFAYSSIGDPAAFSALLQAAHSWVEHEEPVLRRIGTLLLLGHGRWSRRHPVDLELLLGSGNANDHQVLAAAAALARHIRKHSIRTSRGPETPSAEALGIDHGRLRSLLEQVTRLASSSDSIWWLEPYNLDDSYAFLIRSLGDTGRQRLLADLRASDSPGLRARTLEKLSSWISQDPAAWEQEHVTLVLREMESSDQGWGVGPTLDAIARSFPPDHALHIEARRTFRNLIDAAIEAAAQPERRDTTGFHAGHVVPTIAAQTLQSEAAEGPSPLLEELSASDIRTLMGDDLSNLNTWFGVMAFTGPWPEIVPELERRLEGNQSIFAALVLSHLRHPRAFEHLTAQTNVSWFKNAGFATALARYGTSGVDSVLRLLVDQAGQSNVWQRASIDALLLELTRNHPELVRPFHGSELLEHARESTRSTVLSALDHHQWPSAAGILWLDDLASLAPSASAAGTPRSPARSGILAQLLDNTGPLPKRPSALRSFLHNGGIATSRYLFERLAELARTDDRLRGIIVDLLRPLADEGYEHAQRLVASYSAEE